MSPAKKIIKQEMSMKMMYSITTFIEECIPISNGKVQHCKSFNYYCTNLIERPMKRNMCVYV